jgi:hypothetical protein
MDLLQFRLAAGYADRDGAKRKIVARPLPKPSPGD